jgi:hypothetical protein
LNEVLISAGAASIILAIVGGGAKAFGVEVPVLESAPRQVALALAGVAFLGAAVLLRDDDNGPRDGNGPDPTVQGYRQEVRATCRVLQQEQSLPQNQDGSIERDAFVVWFHRGLDRAQRVLARLWARPVPDALHDDAMEARREAQVFVMEARKEVDRLAPELPPRSYPPYAEIQTFDQQLTDAVGEEQQAYESSMSRLADAACTPAAGGGTGG